MKKPDLEAINGKPKNPAPIADPAISAIALKIFFFTISIK